MGNGSDCTAPPPGAGVLTPTSTPAFVAMTDEGKLPRSSVAVTKVVAREVPSAVTSEAEVKPLPFTVTDIAFGAELTIAGSTLVSWGSGLISCTDAGAKLIPVAPEAL